VCRLKGTSISFSKKDSKMTQTKTQEIEALKGTVSELTAKVENLTLLLARSDESVNYWHKNYTDYAESVSKRISEIRTQHSQEIATLRAQYENKLLGLMDGATDAIASVLTQTSQKLRAQAIEANAIIRDLKVAAALEIEKTRSDTLAYAFEHVTEKLANNGNAAELHVRAQGPKDSNTLN
jgi:uncharacterized protein YeaO (DUF488 family)